MISNSSKTIATTISNNNSSQSRFIDSKSVYLSEGEMRRVKEGSYDKSEKMIYFKRTVEWMKASSNMTFISFNINDFRELFKFYISYYLQCKGLFISYHLGNVGIDNSGFQSMILTNILQRLNNSRCYSLDQIDTRSARLLLPMELNNAQCKLVSNNILFDNITVIANKFCVLGKIFESLCNYQTNFSLALANKIIRPNNIGKDDFGYTSNIIISTTKTINRSIRSSGGSLRLWNEELTQRLRDCQNQVVEMMIPISEAFERLANIFHKATPTPLNAYLLYEIILQEFISLTFLYRNLGEKNNIFVDKILEILCVEFSYLDIILKSLRPHAIEVYKALGQNEKDFFQSDGFVKQFADQLQIISKKISLDTRNITVSQSTVIDDQSTQSISEPELNSTSSFNSRGRGRGKGKSNRSRSNRNKPQKKTSIQPTKIQDRKVTKVSVTSIAVEEKTQSTQSTSEDTEFQNQQILKNQQWQNTKEQHKTERLKQKANNAESVGSAYREVKQKIEEDKFAKELSSTKVFYNLPSLQQFEWMYGELSNDNQKIFDALFEAKSFSINSDNIHNLAVQLKQLMIEVGLDPQTAEAFEIEVFNRNHPAHSSDTGNELSESYIRKRCTSFILFGLIPPDWVPSSYDDYQTLQKSEKRRMAWEANQLALLKTKII